MVLWGDSAVTVWQMCSDCAVTDRGLACQEKCAGDRVVTVMCTGAYIDLYAPVHMYRGIQVHTDTCACICMEIYTNSCIDICTDMRVCMCLDLCSNKCVKIWMEMFVDTCIAICIDMCTDMCADMCVDIFDRPAVEENWRLRPVSHEQDRVLLHRVDRPSADAISHEYLGDMPYGECRGA